MTKGSSRAFGLDLPRGGKSPHFGEGAYEDRGCDWFTSCLTCPLIRCRDDLPNNTQVRLVQVYVVELLESRGLRRHKIIEVLGWPERKYQRVIAFARKERQRADHP